MYEWNNYIYELQQIIQKQNEQIRQLEEKVNNLEIRLNETKSPSIDKIEYHFDQLKIERLDGTLHIGLSPNDLANIDDLGIPQLKKQVTYNSVNQRLTPSLSQFVSEQGPKIIRNFSEKYNKHLDNKFEGDIIQDILSQIPDRISFYEAEAKEKHQISSQQQLENYILDHVKQEIYHSLERFMTNENIKKESTNEYRGS